ncbi:hypothetical protein FS837_005601 [Tulasnella sp. UAMH 9824]|nr:hypothetical protein FS837_005601 [Tulasnella sp. UAMH 9824]
MSLLTSLFPDSPWALGALLISSAIALKLLLIGRREKFLPPGPPTKPLLGNILEFPTHVAHFKYTEWARKYGDVISLKIASGTIIVLSSVQSIREIFEKHNAITCDRPSHELTEQLTGGNHILFIHYGPTWKILRRTSYEMLSPHAVSLTLPIQVAESTQLMFDLLHDPTDWYDHFSRYALSVIMSVVHGQRCPRYATPRAQNLIINLKTFSQLVRPGETPPLDLIPALKYVPERFAQWKTTLKNLRNAQREYYGGLMDETRQRMERGNGNGCFMEKIMDRQEEFKLTDEMTLYMGAAMLEAGSDTSASYLQNATQLLIMHPEVQKKAKEELDRVVGPDRLPQPSDMKNLPYIQAVIKEVHRIRPVVTTGVPHVAMADMKYNGNTVPKDSIIFANIWGVYNDEYLFANPSEFNPDRYLENPYGLKKEHGSSSKDWGLLDDMDFGFGRRKCPGIHIAKNSISLNVSRLLWGFDLAKAKREDGTEIELDFHDLEPTVTSTLRPFKCSITPRSERHAATIRREFHEATAAFMPFEQELTGADKEYMRRVREDLI